MRALFFLFLLFFPQFHGYNPSFISPISSNPFPYLSSLAGQSDLLGSNCSTTLNYTNNSLFESNLNILLDTLYSSASQSGFSNKTIGQNPDQVFGLALCRGDLNPSDCATGLNTSMVQIVSLCPNSKNGTIWYDYCMLRYSYVRFYSILDTSYEFDWYYSTVSSVTQEFNYSLGPLMEILSIKAAYDAPLMYSTGKVNYTDTEKIYGMVQCTRDLPRDECYKCLMRRLSEFLSPEIYYNVTMKFYTYSCNVRYDLYLFYNESVTGNALAPPMEITNSTGNLPNSGRKGTRTTIFVCVLVVVSFGILLFVLYICVRRRRRKNQIKLFGNFGDGNEGKRVESMVFDFETLKAATNNFSENNKLGEGGFGSVYKGLINGKEIAVKRLCQSSRQGFVELRNEVLFVAKLQHKNLVKLLGCCVEKQEKLLVYEYLSNLSLDQILFEQLDWETRYKIIEGIGQGLLYLHDDSRLKIIRRDLKTSNILLDENMNPKISDFGLAKLFDQNLTPSYTSHVAGTYGYMAPEYALHGHFSVKSDIFSYGVMILEIVTGCKSAINRVSSAMSLESNDSEHLSTYVWKNWSKGRAPQVLDGCLDGRCILEEALRCIHFALLCAQRSVGERPSISNVMLMLSDQSVFLPAPSTPAFVVPVHSVFSRSDLDANLNELNVVHEGVSNFSYVNGASETEIEPQ